MVLCSGETYIRFAVVPEYATWNPTANSKMSAAWNNDDNWRRSARSELYKENQYTDYQGGGYVPMKFTKVTIPNLSGLYFPSLGYIAYQKSTGIATKLSNAKGDAATTNIQYDMLAQWDANAADHGLNAEGNLECEPFYGNTCDQIYFAGRRTAQPVLSDIQQGVGREGDETQHLVCPHFAFAGYLCGRHLCAGCIGQTGVGGVQANHVLVFGKQSCNQSCISAKLGCFCFCPGSNLGRQL